jgi:hypothetical protein
MYNYLDEILETFDKAVKKHGYGWIVVTKRHLKKRLLQSFVVNEDCKKLSMEAAASFHTIVAQLLYVSKRARLDTSLSIAFLTARVRASNKDD